jgi:hypothetical protein
MDRDHLGRLLAQEGDAFAACRRDVMAGAAIRVWASETPAVELAGIYARRLCLVERRGTAQVGFADAVRTLAGRGHASIRIGAVDVADPPYHFQLFLNQTATEVIACLGIDQGWKAERSGRHSTSTPEQSV